MLLGRVYGFNRTYIGASTTISAFVRIDFVDITFGDSFNRTLINAGSASGAVIINYVSHFNFFLFSDAKVKVF
jgi:hypothetical protein